jgi:hypothetical protein
MAATSVPDTGARQGRHGWCVPMWPGEFGLGRARYGAAGNAGKDLACKRRVGPVKHWHRQAWLEWQGDPWSVGARIAGVWHAQQRQGRIATSSHGGLTRGMTRLVGHGFDGPLG